MKTKAKVVVIGGGVMGVSLIYHLTKLGWEDVVLVEKNELTAGSTWHAAGLCTHYAHNITIMNLRAHSVELYNNILEEETGQPVSFHACGALRVTRNEDRLSEFRQVQGIGKFAGFDFQILDQQQLKEIYPLAEVDDLVGAIYEPLDGFVDPSQATHAMAKGARNRGAKIYRQNEVTGITQQVNGEWLVSTKNGDIIAEHIVNAAGTWCREIGTMMGVDLPVVPMLHQYIVTDRIEQFAKLDKELPMIRDPDESWYLRQERDGVIIGPYEKHGKPWAIDGVPPEFGMELLPEDLGSIEDIAAMAMERVPASAEGGIKSIVNGPITFSPDANPMIGPAYGLNNAWILTGSSMGIMEGGGAGKFLADWMDKGEPPADALAIDSRRFGGYADRDFRVDKAIECFAAQFGIHYPYEERSAGRMKKVTPSYDLLKQQGAVFGSVYGFERPNWFSTDPAITESTLSFGRPNWFGSVGRECCNVRDNVAMADLSVFSKFMISGPDAQRFIDKLGANRAPVLNRIGLNHVLSSSGGVLSEFTITKLGENYFYLVSAAAALRQDEDLLRVRSFGFNLDIKNVTDSKGVFSIMGPNAENLLGSLCDEGLSINEFPWLTARQMTIAGIPILALRVSYIGESGWELHHQIDQQEKLFKALFKTGKRFEMGFYGAFAMNSMRLEMGYRAWGADLTSERTPLESGLKLFVKTEGRDFIGRESLLERKQSNDHWDMAALEFEESDVDPFYSHTIFCDGESVGMVTSGAYGHRLKRSIGLAYFRQKVNATDELRVSILGRAVKATIRDI